MLAELMPRTMVDVFILMCLFSCLYSRSPAEPASDGVLLPPTGIDVSTAIISARMSRTGCGGQESAVRGREALSLTLGTVLS
jgi:hypothetical protein